MPFDLIDAGEDRLQGLGRVADDERAGGAAENGHELGRHGLQHGVQAAA
jgi:hypothetical protein